MSAFIGLLLLAGAYVILYTVNPNLTKCTLPTISGVVSSQIYGPNIPVGQVTQPGQPAAGNCASGGCTTLSNCTQTSKTVGAGAVNCGAAQGVVDTMSCIQKNDPNLNYKVTEGYPPAVAHLSAGHNNGCSIDVQVTGGNVCQSIQQLQQAAVQCGAPKPINEYASCNGTTYNTTTGNNVHINSIKGDGGC